MPGRAIQNSSRLLRARDSFEVIRTSASDVPNSGVPVGFMYITIAAMKTQCD